MNIEEKEKLPVSKMTVSWGFFVFFFYGEYDYISSFSERILEDFQPLQISQGFPFIYQLIFNIRHYY